MRITVDIPDEILRELLEVTNEKKMSPAVAKAVEEYIKRKRTSDFGALVKSGIFELKES